MLGMVLICRSKKYFCKKSWLQDFRKWCLFTDSTLALLGFNLLASVLLCLCCVLFTTIQNMVINSLSRKSS